jgi:hypothetical protein
MKRIELLEALFLQGKLMRELQLQLEDFKSKTNSSYFSEMISLVNQSIEADAEFDRMLKELTEWWDEALVNAETEEVK